MSAGKPSGTTEKPTWWCNFCDFKAEDQALYLKHSCADELKKAGKTAEKSDKTHCS